MTITNPFTLTPLTSTPEHERDAAQAPVTPYETLCRDAARPAAFTMTFTEPLAA